VPGLAFKGPGFVSRTVAQGSNGMNNVITFKSVKSKHEVKPDEALFSAADGLLHSNANLARAVEDLSVRFLAVDEAVARVAATPYCRRYIDSVAAQDRGRLYAAMLEVLNANLEYTKGVEARGRAIAE
jgi:hypothetical protein